MGLVKSFASYPAYRRMDFYRWRRLPASLPAHSWDSANGRFSTDHRQEGRHVRPARIRVYRQDTCSPSPDQPATFENWYLHSDRGQLSNLAQVARTIINLMVAHTEVPSRPTPVHPFQCVSSYENAPINRGQNGVKHDVTRWRSSYNQFSRGDVTGAIEMPGVGKKIATIYRSLALILTRESPSGVQCLLDTKAPHISGEVLSIRPAR